MTVVRATARSGGRVQCYRAEGAAFASAHSDPAGLWEGSALAPGQRRRLGSRSCTGCLRGTVIDANDESRLDGSAARRELPERRTRSTRTAGSTSC